MGSRGGILLFSLSEVCVSVYGLFTVKKKKPSLLNKFDKTLKSEINAAEKLRKKVGTSACFLTLTYCKKPNIFK